MNFLPFVLIVIVIFSLYSLSWLESGITGKKESSVYTSYFQGLRELRNQKAQQARLAKLPQEEKEALELPKDEVYFREKWEGASLGRLNLFSLLSSEIPNSPLYQVALDYLENLYGKHLFGNKDQGTCKKILDELLKIQREHLKNQDRPLELYSIELEDPYLKEKYFKMLTGTQTYNLIKKEGYLPLSQAIEFKKNDSKPINFNYANVLLLEALFGKKSTHAIIEKEQENQRDAEKPTTVYSLNENDLKDILWKNPTNSAVYDLLDYKKVKKEPPLSWTDPKTHITVRMGSGS